MATMKLKAEEEKLLKAQSYERQAQLALTICGYMWKAALAFLILDGSQWLLFKYPQLLANAILVILPVLGAVAYPFFHRRGQATVGAYIFLASILGMLILLPGILPEIMPGVAIAYIMAIILGNLVLSGRNGLWVVGVGALCFVFDMFLLKTWPTGWFPPLDPTAGFLVGLVIGSAELLAGGAIIYMVIQGQDKLFRQVQIANWEIEGRVATEQEQRKLLQQANVEIEQRAATDREQRESLQRLVLQIRDVVNNLNAATAEILAATTQQASGASEQSAAISQTTTTVDEVKVIAEQASARAQEVAGAAQRTVEVSRSGQKAVRDTIESMEQIKERVEGIAENILALSEQTQQIGEIIATVNDLASQSNILALNASIEAARAGEHGKGFAVVSVEVRNLAEQSRQATTQVKTILSEIQKATNATVMATEEGTKRVDMGVGLASQARQTIEQLSGVINESAQAAAQMVAGGRQQVSGIEQIALAMRNINQATVQSLASTRQAEKSAQSLNELARSLSQTVEQYQL